MGELGLLGCSGWNYGDTPDKGVRSRAKGTDSKYTGPVSSPFLG